MNNVIIVNGPDHNPQWNDLIALSYDLSGTTSITPVAALVAGGQLLDGSDYFYKVVAVMDQLLIEGGDGGNQLSAWTIKSPEAGIYKWRLWDDAGDRYIQIYKNQEHILAVGSRTGDGVITFSEKMNSGISGTVTVAYTADDTGTLEIKKDTLVGYTEVTETPSGANLTIRVSWTAPLGVVKEYRIYKGMATGEYDYFYTSAATPLTDTGVPGILVPKCDVKIPKDGLSVMGSFKSATTISGREYPAKSGVHFEGPTICMDVDLTKVTNQPTWNLGTMASTQAADNDINNWL